MIFFDLRKFFVIFFFVFFSTGARPRAAAGAPTNGRGGRRPANHAPPTREAGRAAPLKNYEKHSLFASFSRVKKKKKKRFAIPHELQTETCLISK